MHSRAHAPPKTREEWLKKRPSGWGGWSASSSPRPRHPNRGLRAAKACCRPGRLR